MTTANLSNISNSAIGSLGPLPKFASIGPGSIVSIGAAGIVYSLGLNWLMSERARCQQRAQLVELAVRWPAVSAVTFSAVYLFAASLLMLATATLSILVAYLAGGWSNHLTVMIGVGGAATRMLLVLRSLRKQ